MRFKCSRTVKKHHKHKIWCEIQTLIPILAIKKVSYDRYFIFKVPLPFWASMRLKPVRVFQHVKARPFLIGNQTPMDDSGKWCLTLNMIDFNFQLLHRLSLIPFHLNRFSLKTSLKTVQYTKSNLLVAHIWHKSVRDPINESQSALNCFSERIHFLSRSSLFPFDKF